MIHISKRGNDALEIKNTNPSGELNLRLNFIKFMIWQAAYYFNVENYLYVERRRQGDVEVVSDF